jgi:hypothetical protein
MSSLKRMVLTGWNAGRVMQAVIAVIIGIAAIVMGDVMLGLFSAFFLFQALTNTGCCGTAGCYVPPRHTKARASETEYEEIK